MPDLVSVQLAAVEALAGRLTVLGADLAEESELTASCGRSLADALGDPVGTGAGSAARTAAAALGVLAERTAAVAGTLLGAVASYRELDALVGERVGAGAWAPVAR